jgi:TonB family protein
MTAISFRSSTLPWALAHEDEERFRKLFLALMGFVIVFGIALRFITLPPPEPTAAITLPPIAAKLLLDTSKPPPPPPPPAKTEKVEPPKPDLKDKSEPAPLPTKPVPRERPVVEARQPIPGKPPGEDREAARNKAAGVGLLAALKDQPPEVHGAPLAVQLNQNIDKKGAGVGTGVGVGVGAGKEQGLPDRNMITSNAAGGSGGINTAGFSRDSGGGGLAGRSTTLVAGVAGGGGGGGPGLGGAITGSGGRGTGAGVGNKGGTLSKSGSGKASRSLEELSLAVARVKGSLYAMYNRALREDASLQGKIVVEFTIAPSGAITDCHIKSSELKNPELEQKLVARLKAMEFRAEDVEVMIASQTLDFLPSGN